jgi:hypothetical protein
MKGTLDKFFTLRLKFVHLLAILSVSASCFAAEKAKKKKNILEAFNPNHRIQTRGPQSHMPDVDYAPAPERLTFWYENILVEDSSGVLVSMRKDFDRWEEQEEYVKNWNLESTGLYAIKTGESKKNYFNKRILKYVDKRISGEVKRAEKGSALASVGKAQKALKPNTKVSISRNIKLKFKARILQGTAIMKVVNPYVDYKATYSFSDGVKMNMKKEFKGVRATASVDYKPSDKQYVTNFDKSLTNRVSARVSSTQSHDTGIFSNDSDSRIQLMYSSPFNY